MLDAATAAWPEVQEFLARRPVAVLAFGAQEEHGPHAPLQTDTLLAGALARRIATEMDLLLLPPVPYGETWSTSGYPGTLSLSFATVQAILAGVWMFEDHRQGWEPSFSIAEALASFRT